MRRSVDRAAEQAGELMTTETPNQARPKAPRSQPGETSRRGHAPRLTGAVACVVAIRLFAGSSLLNAAGSASDQHWPQWRGPLQNGVAPHADPPTEWSETKNVKWKVKIPGEGHATPIVWGDKVFVLSASSTGKKVERPTAAGEQDQRPGGPPEGGPGGFGPGSFLGRQMLAAGDKNSDQKLSREEFSSLANAWFDKLDSEKTDKLEQEKFGQRLGDLTGPPPEVGPGGPGGFGGRGGRAGARSAGPGLFTAADANKDGTLTREEFKATFAKWFTEWDADKSGALGEDKLREGLNAALARPQFGGPGGRGGRGGFGGGPPPDEVYQFAVLCLDRQSGKVLWQQTAREEAPHQARHQTGSFASASAVTDGQHVVAHFGSRGLYCYDLNGRLQWSQDLGDLRIANNFGEGSSPALFGNTLVLLWDHEGEDFIVALDKTTGQELWRQSRDERTSWSTPLIVQHDGATQVVTTATGKIRSYELASGKLLWECSGMTSNVIPSPVAGHGMVYCMSGFRGNALLAIRLGKSGDLTDSDAIAWRHGRATPYVPSPLLYGDRLYFLSNNNGVLSCFDAVTGKPLYTEQRLEQVRNVYASPIGAAGRVYLVGRDGAALVIKHGETFEVLAANELDDSIDASPVAVGKELFLRGHENLYCLAEK
jgi:outer membrane protein assembly factor BamB